MANKEQGSGKNVKKVAKLSLKQKRAIKREKRAQKGETFSSSIIHSN